MLSCVSRIAIAALFLALLSVAGRSTLAQTHRLEIRVDDLYRFSPLPPRGEIEVKITNPTDSIAGISLWLKTSRPNIMRFRTSGFSDYQDSVGGTILGDWEYLQARSLTGDGSDIKITALAEGNLVPPINRGIGPSSASRLLVRLPYEIIPGTDTIADPYVQILVDTESPVTFGFSTPTGLTIPCFDTAAPIPILDTTAVGIQNGGLYVEHCSCLADGDINGDGVGLSVGDLVNTLRTVDGMVDPPDSLCHVDFNGDCTVDTADANLYMRYFDSGIIIFGWPPFPRTTCCYVALRTCCQGRTGNVDCDPEDRVDISDITTLIDNLYISMTPLCCWGEANVDGDPGRTVDIADLSALIDFLYISYTLPRPCF